MRVSHGIYALLMMSAFFLNAQDHKFGKVSKEELQQKIYPKDSSASALVLYRKVNVYYNYVQSIGFQVMTEIHERIKVYGKEGFDYATVEERLYVSGGDNESLKTLKGYTYNLEGDKVVKTKLKATDAFTEKTSKYYKKEKFTMPNVKEGSVIEYQYRIISPFSYSIDEIVLQYDIPIVKQDISISIPEYFSFSTNMKGYLGISPRKSTHRGKINIQSKSREGNGNITSTKFSSNEIDYAENITSFNMSDVPALKEEPYVNNMNNYRSSINYEIKYVKFPNSIGKSYATTWEKVVKTIYDSDNFGRQLDHKRYFKDDLEAIVAQNPDKIGKMNAIFSHVKNHMNWNGYIGKYTDEGVKEAYRKKSGSIADINLMLVAMLKEAGLTANPVLISTRNNGVPLFPTREGFNYVIAAVALDGHKVLLDASNKYSEPDLLPVKAINWIGRSINEDGSSSEVSLVPKKSSEKTTYMNVSIAENGTVEGKQRQILTRYNAYIFRNRYASVDVDSYLEKKENDNNGMEISNYSLKNKKVLGKPIIESFDFLKESQVDVIGDKIFFSPLFFNAEEENPFKLDNRNYPVDFVFPWQEKYITTVKIPEGYKVNSLPENINIVLPGNVGRFMYQIKENVGGLQLSVTIKFDQAIVPANSYLVLKNFYKTLVEKETEQVVLIKI